MKNNTLKFLAVGTLCLTLMMGSTAAFAVEDQSSSVSSAIITEAYGSAAVLAGQTYTIEEMLRFAIQDEYAAQAEYDAIMKAFDVTRPYSNIIKSEGTHIDYLMSLYDTYGYTVPSNTATEHVVLPTTLNETYAIGVDAEIKNIDMYKVFLDQDLPDDVEAIFEVLQKASENHLKAFQNQVDRSTVRIGGTGNSGVKGFGWQR